MAKATTTDKAFGMAMANHLDHAHQPFCTAPPP